MQFGVVNLGVLHDGIVCLQYCEREERRRLGDGWLFDAVERIHCSLCQRLCREIAASVTTKSVGDHHEHSIS